MSIEKRIGKIDEIYFGFGGYQDAQFGITIVLCSKKDSWGVLDFKGHWGTNRSKSTKWTDEEREIHLGKMCMWAKDLLSSANKKRLEQLVGVPVEVTFDGNTLKEWRILTEVM